MNFQRKIKAVPIQAFGIVALLFIFGAFGCNGISTKGAPVTCEAKTAQIIVFDGGMKRVCGCTEGSGTFTQSGTFVCTVSFNSAVYFDFSSIGGTHVVSINNIGTTQQMSSSSSIKTSALMMNQIGTFSFVDSFDGFSGTFIVNP